MGEQFEDRDLSEAVFWGVNLQRSHVRDADLSGSTFFHTLWSDVSIDGVIDRLVINGVDVTDYVDAHDRWYPLRTQLEPSTASDLRQAWATLHEEWATLLRHVTTLPSEIPHRSVNGEWSLSDTLRHLVFAIDKWFSWPVLGEREFSSIGLPNSGSQDGDWPGIDRDADPTFEDVLAVWGARISRFADFIDGLEFETLPETVEVSENGSVPTVMCFHVVLEEVFEHLRYMLRDLEITDGSSTSS